jgi:hypothetical protein
MDKDFMIVLLFGEIEGRVSRHAHMQVSETGFGGFSEQPLHRRCGKWEASARYCTLPLFCR